MRQAPLLKLVILSCSKRPFCVIYASVTLDVIGLGYFWKYRKGELILKLPQRFQRETMIRHGPLLGYLQPVLEFHCENTS